MVVTWCVECWSSVDFNLKYFSYFGFPIRLRHQTGVFRSDLPEKFRLVPSAIQGLIDNVDRDLTFAIEVESGVQRDTVSNYDEVCTFLRCRSFAILCLWCSS